jgi:hypothetical protein
VDPGETESVAIRQNPGRRKNNSEICPFELCLLVCLSPRPCARSSLCNSSLVADSREKTKLSVVFLCVLETKTSNSLHISGGVNTARWLFLFVLCQTRKKGKKSLPDFELFPPFFFFASIGVRGPSFTHSASSFRFCATKRRKCRKSYIQGLLVICIYLPLEHYSLCFCFSLVVFVFFPSILRGFCAPFFLAYSSAEEELSIVVALCIILFVHRRT